MKRTAAASVSEVRTWKLFTKRTQTAGYQVIQRFTTYIYYIRFLDKKNDYSGVHCDCMWECGSSTVADNLWHWKINICDV